MSRNPERVILPQAFIEAQMDHLVLLIADMLVRLCQHNDRIPLLPESLTRFHSRSAPAISILEYLRRIVRFVRVEKSILLLTLHYIDQICAPSKGYCDVCCTNTLYAKVGGISVAELNALEREFLHAIDWRLTCTGEVLQEYYVNLIRTHGGGGFALLGDPSPTPTPTGSPSATATSTVIASDSDIDMDFSSAPSSAPPSPSPAPSTILIDVPPSARPRPTLEQNIAFAMLQQSRDRQDTTDPDRES